MKRCSRCVTPGSLPGVSFDQSGVCSHCRDYERETQRWESSRTARLRSLEALIARARSRSRYYDALIGLSGGKDSTYVLYLAAKKYNLKVLCYNFDNGFQTETARENIQNAVRATGADLFVFHPNHDLLMKLYSHFYEHTGLFCPVCMRGIYVGAFSLIREYSIPLSLGGSSKRTEERAVPEIFQAGDLSFFDRVLKKHPFPGDIRIMRYERTALERLSRALFLLSRGKLVVGSVKIQLPDYMDWKYDEIFRAIREIGWQPLPDRDEHVDCEADPVVHYQRQLQVPDLTYNTLKYSAWIRSAQMDRDEALRLTAEESKVEEPPGLDAFIGKLGMNKEEFSMHMQNRLRQEHVAYQKESLLMRMFRSVVR